MATTQGLIDRARLELGDRPTVFTTSGIGDGLTSRFETPLKPLQTASITVTITVGSTLLPQTRGVDYTVSEDNGFIDFGTPPPAASFVSISGSAWRYFSDANWTQFVNSAVQQHTYGRTGVSLVTLPGVEEYPVSLLAVIQAMYALMNDSAFDIDISTPEGVAIPRHQRFDQLMQMLMARKDQYDKYCAALNVGLNRIEMFDLRRVSRATNRLVPVYEEMEIDDTRLPQRVFIPIDTKGQQPVPGDTPAVYDISLRRGNTYSLPLQFPFDLTGFTVYASVRRYVQSSRIRDFTVNVTNAALGQVTISLSATDTMYLQAECFWSLDLHDASGNEHTYMTGRVEVQQSRLGGWSATL